MKLMKPYLIFMVIVWLPWGLQCIFNLPKIEEIIGVTGINPTGNTDIRVMYGGVQFAVGLMAAFALFRKIDVKHVLVALAFLGCSMAASRGYGMMVDNSATLYNWGVLGFEAFAGISAILWLRKIGSSVLTEAQL